MILLLGLPALAVVYALAFGLCRAAGRKRGEYAEVEAWLEAQADPGYPESRVRLPRPRGTA